jgi:putative membrane protein
MYIRGGWDVANREGSDMGTDINGQQGAVRLKLSWTIAVLWLATFGFSLLDPESAAGKAAGGLHSLLLLAFVIVHGSLAYGWRGFGSFALIGAVVAFLAEACSIATSFPYGFYVHHTSLGGNPLGVPLSIPPANVVLGWFAWTLGCLITRQRPGDAGGLNTFTTPIIAAFIFAGWDLTYDPIGATVRDMFTYRFPSGQMGVPLKNFIGWLLVGWTFFQLFAAVEVRFSSSPAVNRSDFWLMPCLIWFATALQYPFLFAAAPDGTVTRGVRTFVIADVFEAAVIMALFTMTFTALIAIFRLYGARR